MIKIFTHHPSLTGESYCGHFVVAAGFGVTMLVGGLCVLIHAVFPFAFVAAAGRTMEKLQKRMADRMERMAGRMDGISKQR